MTERVNLVVGRIGRAHGLRGEVSVAVRTDDVDRRFVVGTRLATEPDRGALLILATRVHQGRLLVAFDGVVDRTQAEALSETDLLVDVTDEAAAETSDDAWFIHQLVGCRAETPDGVELGVVTGVAPAAAQDLLVVRSAGRDVLVPFVTALVPVVDVANGRVVIDPPGGLFDE